MAPPLGSGQSSPIFLLPASLQLFFPFSEIQRNCKNLTMEPPAKRSRKLLEDDSSSDSGDESGGVPLGDSSEGVTFKINEEYARRFEHNKRREEMQQRTCNVFEVLGPRQNLIVTNTVYSRVKTRENLFFRTTT
jgi:hypothetical protein